MGTLKAEQCLTQLLPSGPVLFPPTSPGTFSYRPPQDTRLPSEASRAWGHLQPPRPPQPACFTTRAEAKTAPSRSDGSAWAADQRCRPVTRVPPPMAYVEPASRGHLGAEVLRWLVVLVCPQEKRAHLVGLWPGQQKGSWVESGFCPSLHTEQCTSPRPPRFHLPGHGPCMTTAVSVTQPLCLSPRLRWASTT